MARHGRKNRFTVSITGKVTLTVNHLVTVVVLVLLGLAAWYQR
ncbi:hypothetical protein AB0N89_13050 [Amycolatopsis sp. NPDC089917]